MFNELVFELRTWDTDRLCRERERVIVERRKLRTRELALTRVLDERVAFPEGQPARDGETEAQSRRKRETARKLEDLPNLGDAAMNGELSSGQLDPATDLVGDDAAIAETAKRTSPHDLQRMAREKHRERDREKMRRDSLRRRNRQYLRKRRGDDGFVVGSFALPMEHGGAIVESFFDR